MNAILRHTTMAAGHTWPMRRDHTTTTTSDQQQQQQQKQQ